MCSVDYRAIMQKVGIKAKVYSFWGMCHSIAMMFVKAAVLNNLKTYLERTLFMSNIENIKKSYQSLKKEDEHQISAFVKN